MLASMQNSHSAIRPCLLVVAGTTDQRVSCFRLPLALLSGKQLVLNVGMWFLRFSVVPLSVSHPLRVPIMGIKGEVKM